MAKDSEESVKKRKKPETETNGKTSTSDKTSPDEKRPHIIPIYQRISSFEENESLTRDPNRDVSMYQQTCKEFSQAIKDIADLKENKPKGWEEAVVEKKIEAAILTVTMKKLNRIEKLRNKSSRDNILKERQELDILQLQLQNLICEMQRLRKEVDNSKPLGIDLVEVNEFYEQAPSSISRPEVTKTDSHHLQLARLEWELKQRKELAILFKQRDEKKTLLTKLIEKKTDDLDSLLPLIRDVLKITKPMQETLGLPSIDLSSDSLSNLLPNSLYFLYIQTRAYREACDKRITVEICGDEEKAKLLKTEMQATNTSSEDSDQIEIASTSKKLKKAKLDQKKKQLLTKHPLTVILSIKFKDETKISLEFSYLTKLNILTVMPKLILPGKITSPSSSLLVDENNLLTDLFPGDTGIESPNVANYYQLKDVGFDNLDPQKIGFPYIWVQRLGGYDFAAKSGSKIEPNQELSKLSVPIATKAIYSRIKSRLALITQITGLETGTVTIPPEMKSVKISCNLKSWEPYTWSQFCKHPAAQNIKDTEMVSPQDIFFKGTVIRGQAKLTILVSVKCNYPLSCPIAVLQLETKGNIMNGCNNHNINNIEKEVNYYWKELVSEKGWGISLLNNQIHRIMVCFDIMLECDDPEIYTGEKKTFFHSFRGRNRAHPYKFVSMGDGVFVQR